MRLAKTLLSCLVVFSVVACAESGVDGVDGINGVDGADGAPGVAGVPGTNGTDGQDGVDGAQGPAGVDGVDGTDGADGADGVDGVDGVDLTECIVGDGSISNNYVIEYCGDYVSISNHDIEWKLVGGFQSSPVGCDMGEDECEGYAEVPAYDPATSRAFVVNAVDSSVDIIDLSTPASPTLFG